MNQNKGLNSEYYQSLTRNMILTVVIVSFAPMILVSGVIFSQFRESYNEKVYVHLDELTMKHQHNIDNFINEKMNNIRFLAKTSSFEELSDESFLRKRLATFRQEYDNVFEDLGMINEQGLQIAYAGPFDLAKAQYFEADWFKKAIKTQYFISDVFLGLRDLPHFIVAVRQNFQGRYWILRATINFVAFNDLVTNIRIGKTGFAFILNRKGELQTQKTILEALPSKDIYTDLLKNRKKDEGKVYIVEAVDDFGNKNIYSSAFLKNGDWMLICQQNKADAFSSLKRNQSFAVLIFFIGGCGIITTALLLSRKMVGRIAKADHEKEIMNQKVIETSKLAAVGELAAGVAHEINNPLTTILTTAMLIQEDIDPDGQMYADLEMVAKETLRCRKIVTSLLDFARKTKPAKKPCNINEIVAECILLTRKKAAFNEIAIAQNLSEEIPTVLLDKDQIEQALINIILNAVEATSPGGSVTILTTFFPQDEVIEIAIVDTGEGIAADNIDKLFDPFFTTKESGTGLGLAITHGIIEQHGGTINISSKPGQGTTFTIRLHANRDNNDEH